MPPSRKAGRRRLPPSSSSPSSCSMAEGMPEAYCVANDLEQAQSRVFEMIRRIIEASPLLRNDAKVSADKITFPPRTPPSPAWPATTHPLLADIPPSPYSTNCGATFRACTSPLGRADPLPHERKIAAALWSPTQASMAKAISCMNSTSAVWPCLLSAKLCTRAMAC